MTLMFAAGALALLVASGFFIWLTVLAFKEGAGWGLAVFFLPFAVIFFAIKHWQVARRPFLFYMGTSVAGLMLLFASGIMAGMQAGAMMEAEMMAAMQQAEEEGFDFDSFDENSDAVVDDAAEPGGDNDALAARRPIVVDATSDPAEMAAPSRASREEPPARQLSSLPPDGRIKPARAGRYVGERMRVTGRGGLEIIGTLRETKGDRLKFEKELAGGTVSFEMTRREIEKLVVLRR